MIPDIHSVLLYSVLLDLYQLLINICNPVQFYIII